MKQINMNDGRYYETPLGKMPSVTTILNILKKEAITIWAINTTIEYIASKLEDVKSGKFYFDKKSGSKLFKEAKEARKKLSEEAMDVGSKVHRLIELHLKQEFPEESEQDYIYNEQVKRGYEAFIKWEEEMQVSWVESEMKVYSKEGFAGTLDAVAKIKDKLFVIDFKTSKAVYDDYLMQIAAYMKAYEEMSGKKIEGVGILRLDKLTGKPQFVSTLDKWKIKDVEKAYKMFLCLTKYYNLLKEK